MAQRMERRINAACDSLARKYKLAVRRKDTEAQKLIIKKAKKLGILSKREGYRRSPTILELHSNYTQSAINKQESHLAPFDGRDEMLMDDHECSWAEEGWVSTLNQSRVAVPE